MQVPPQHGKSRMGQLGTQALALVKRANYARARMWGMAKLSAARIWIALAPLRAVLVRLTTIGEPPNRRLRPPAFWACALGLCGLAAGLTMAVGGALVLGLDPLRGFSAPLGKGHAQLAADQGDIQLLRRQNDAHLASLEGLEARAEALNRPASELEILRAAETDLREMGARLQGLGKDKPSAPRRKAEQDALRTRMETTSKAAITRFGVLLAQGLRKQIQDDTALAGQLREAGWLGDLGSTISGLRQANTPLSLLETQLAGAQSAMQALALANRIADIGAAISRFRLPLPQAADALQARQAYAQLEAEIRAVLNPLQEQANDRPWIFASSERKEAWRAAMTRLEMLQPLLLELDALKGQVLNSSRPETVRSALLRSAQIKQALLIGMSSSLPTASAQAAAGPSSVLLDARKRTQRLSTAAENAYREAFERTSGIFEQPLRRRRDRDRVQDLRESMKRLYDMTIQLSALDRAAQATDSEAQAVQSADQASSLAEAHAQTMAQITRSARALGN